MGRFERDHEADRFAEGLTNVDSAFAWAETHAKLGDYEYAIKWVDVGIQLSDNPPPGYADKRRAWKKALSRGRRRSTG